MDASRETLLNLLELQKVDSTIDRLEARRRNLPEQAELEALEERLALLEKTFGEQQSITDEIVSRQTKLDGEIEMLRTKLSTEEQKLYGGGITSPKELSALQAEIESIKRRIGSLEDSDLAVMEERETAERELGVFEEEVDSTRRNIEDATRRRDAASKEIDEQLEAARSERQTWVPKFNSELLTYYDDLRLSKGGVAIAALVDGACQGCHMQLPVQEAVKVRQSEGMAYCDECRRILVPI